MAYIEQDRRDGRHRAGGRGGLSAARDRQRRRIEFQRAGRHAASASIVGVNKYVDKGEGDNIPTLKIDHEVERAQIERIKTLKATRDAAAAEARARRGQARGRAATSNLVMPVTSKR